MCRKEPVFAHSCLPMCNKQPFSTHTESLLSPPLPTPHTEHPLRAQTSTPQATPHTEYPLRAQTSTPQVTPHTEYPLRAQTSIPPAPKTRTHPPAPATPAVPAVPVDVNRATTAHKKRAASKATPFVFLLILKIKPER